MNAVIPNDGPGRRKITLDTLELVDLVHQVVTCSQQFNCITHAAARIFGRSFSALKFNEVASVPCAHSNRCNALVRLVRTYCENPAPPKKPWNVDSPVNTDKRYGVSCLLRWCLRGLRNHPQ